MALEEADPSKAGTSRPEDESGADDSRSLKRIKLVKNEAVYLRELPSCEAYEKSYMHRDVITHVLVITKTQFLITASRDGFLKFWKKTINGIDFVKTFKSHLGPIEDVAATSKGGTLASISKGDRSVRIYSVEMADMFTSIELEFEPNCIEWTQFGLRDNLLIADSKEPKIFVYDYMQPERQLKHIIEGIHDSTICRMRFNHKYKTIMSADIGGHFRYWRQTDGGSKLRGQNLVRFQSTEESDIGEFSQKKIRIHNITFTPNEDYFATTSSDRKIRIFRFRSGERLRLYDESLTAIEELQKAESMTDGDGMKFARKMAIERELDKNSLIIYENPLFDRSGTFILYPTMQGVKIYNWQTNRFIRSLGKDETNLRPLSIGLFQGLVYERPIIRYTPENILSGVDDPTLFCSAYKSKRFYCFSNRYFEEDSTVAEDGELLKDRDVFNEKPSRDEIMAAIEVEQLQLEKRLYENATVHTTMGDIHLKLFPKQAPKACENFLVHSKKNYYNNHIFHRVIKNFMIQTGDPTGTGTGGESIWGDDFEDEFCDELRHDKPFILSMANNCTPNTNGSQFFITVAPCPFLDNKHTIFGRVVRGMDVCQNISKVKTNSKTDMPLKDIRIISISIQE